MVVLSKKVEHFECYREDPACEKIKISVIMPIPFIESLTGLGWQRA